MIHFFHDKYEETKDGFQLLWNFSFVKDVKLFQRTMLLSCYWTIFKKISLKVKLYMNIKSFWNLRDRVYILYVGYILSRVTTKLSDMYRYSLFW